MQHPPNNPPGTPSQQNSQPPHLGNNLRQDMNGQARPLPPPFPFPPPAFTPELLKQLSSSGLPPPPPPAFGPMPLPNLGFPQFPPPLAGAVGSRHMQQSHVHSPHQQAGVNNRYGVPPAHTAPSPMPGGVSATNAVPVGNRQPSDNGAYASIGNPSYASFSQLSHSNPIEPRRDVPPSPQTMLREFEQFSYCLISDHVLANIATAQEASTQEYRYNEEQPPQLDGSTLSREISEDDEMADQQQEDRESCMLCACESLQD